jgi:pimeloyl-ACP methyl ester carboxylesterase
MEKELRFQNKSIHYWIEGSGAPVMMIHGFAEDHHVWDLQINALRENWQLIIPDLPGSGKSELLDSTSIDSMAEVVLAILDNESIAQCCIIGHSMGGYITLAFAEKHTDRLNSFCLFHSTAYPDSEEKKQTRLKAIEFIKKNGVEEFLKTSTPNLFAKETTGDEGLMNGQSRKKMIQKLIDDYKSMKPEALIAYYQAMINRQDRREVLKTFTKPILFLLGREDTAVPYQQGLEQSSFPPKAEVHTLEHSGHMGMWEETVEANRILLAFCKTNVRRNTLSKN